MSTCARAGDGRLLDLKNDWSTHLLLGRDGGSRGRGRDDDSEVDNDDSLLADGSWGFRRSRMIEGSLLE